MIYKIETIADTNSLVVILENTVKRWYIRSILLGSEFVKSLIGGAM